MTFFVFGDLYRRLTSFNGFLLSDHECSCLLRARGTFLSLAAAGLFRQARVVSYGWTCLAVLPVHLNFLKAFTALKIESKCLRWGWHAFGVSSDRRTSTAAGRHEHTFKIFVLSSCSGWVFLGVRFHCFLDVVMQSLN